jgi:hypothetical protein
MESPGAYASPGTGAALGAPSITAEVVTVDRTARTVTLRETTTTGGRQPSHKVTVSSAASDMLRDIKAGDRVTVTCETGTGAAGTRGTTGTTGEAGSLVNCTSVTTITKASGATTGR